MLLSNFLYPTPKRYSILHKNRLRFNGKKINSVEEYRQIVLSLLKQRPLTPKHLSIILGKSTKSIQRYLKPLRTESKISKIPGSNKYQIADQNYTFRSLEMILLGENEFFQCETIKKWFKHASSTKNGITAIKQFKSLCLGKWSEDFKINPDLWIHPSTTEACIDVLRKKYQKTQLSQTHRMIIRNFLKYGLGLPISKEEAKELGIGGHKDNIGQYATVSFEKGQYEKAKKWIKKNHEKRELVLFGFKFWTFCRPSTTYTIQCNQLKFYDRKMEYVQTKDDSSKPIRVAQYLENDQRIVLNPDLDNIVIGNNSNFTKKIVIERACSIDDLMEFKTGKSYPKYIFDDKLVRILEKYVEKRQKTGFRYVFWDNNDTEFTFENYNRLVISRRKHDNSILKQMFRKIGCNGKIFEHNANYAMRHVGVQHWLDLTNYDFDLVSDMGWEDINTLRQWYGRRNRQRFEKQLMQISM